MCVANLLWRNYGDAGFACQPQTAAASKASCAARRWWQEASAAQHHHFVEEAIRAADATALGGPGFRLLKIVFYWSQMRPCVMSDVRRRRHSNKTEVSAARARVPGSCLGGTHFTNCANLRHARLPTATKLFSDAPARRFLHANGRLPPTMVADEMCHSFSGASGDPIASGLASGGVWINHYQFQSLEHWEAKKARGRTSMNRKRKGSPPPYFNAVEDAAGALALQRASARWPRRRCATAWRAILAAARLARRRGADSRCAAALCHPRSSTTGGRGGGALGVGATSISSLAGCAACSSSKLYGSAGSSLFDWLTRTPASASTRTHRSMGTGARRAHPRPPCGH